MIMKRLLLLISALAAVASASCTKDKSLLTEVRDYADSTAHSYLTIHAELPVPASSASKEIRSELIDVLDRQLSHITFGEEERFFPKYEGDENDTDALLGYYKDQTLALIGRLSQEDADERERYLEEDILPEMPSWGFDFTLKKVADTLGYVVFMSQNYIYMGGAHGGITGEGYLTFDRKSGRRVDPMLDPACTDSIQSLLEKGLLDYYGEYGETMTSEALRERLQIEGELIPLPSWTPYPSAEGINFIYQQYEIACYADGMPSFTIPYQDIKPFLAPEARELLGRAISRPRLF